MDYHKVLQTFASMPEVAALVPATRNAAYAAHSGASYVQLLRHGATLSRYTMPRGVEGHAIFNGYLRDSHPWYARYRASVVFTERCLVDMVSICRAAAHIGVYASLIGNNNDDVIDTYPIWVRAVSARVRASAAAAKRSAFCNLFGGWITTSCMELARTTKRSYVARMIRTGFDAVDVRWGDYVYYTLENTHRLNEGQRIALENDTVKVLHHAGLLPSHLAPLIGAMPSLPENVRAITVRDLTENEMRSLVPRCKADITLVDALVPAHQHDRMYELMYN